MAQHRLLPRQYLILGLVAVCAPLGDSCLARGMTAMPSISLAHPYALLGALITAVFTPWIAAGPNGLGRVLGVFADDAANTLWVCTNDTNPNGTNAELKSFDLKTAAPKGSYPFPGGGLCNDIAVARDGHRAGQGRRDDERQRDERAHAASFAADALLHLRRAARTDGM